MTAEEEILMENLQKEKAALAFQLKALEKETVELKTFVQNLSNKVDDLTKDNRDLAKENEAHQDQVTDLENDLEDALDNECHHDEDLIKRKTEAFDASLSSLVENIKFLRRKLAYSTGDFVIREAFESILKDAAILDAEDFTDIGYPVTSSRKRY